LEEFVKLFPGFGTYNFSPKVRDDESIGGKHPLE